VSIVGVHELTQHFVPLTVLVPPQFPVWVRVAVEQVKEGSGVHTELAFVPVEVLVPPQFPVWVKDDPVQTVEESGVHTELAFVPVLVLVVPQLLV